MFTPEPAQASRAERALLQLAAYDVTFRGHNRAVVTKLADGTRYVVTPDSCSCPDHSYRPELVCKRRLMANMTAVINAPDDEPTEQPASSAPEPFAPRRETPAELAARIQAEKTARAMRDRALLWD
jgi:hypothetical protein